MLADFFDALLVALPFEDVELVAAFMTAFFVLSLYLMVFWGFLFRAGWRFADWLIHDIYRACEMCVDMFLAFIRWLWKKVRR